MKTKDTEKKAASAAVAAAAAAGMLLNGLFSSPAELAGRDETAPPPPAPVIEYVLADAEPDDGDDAAAPDEEKEKRDSFRSRLRRKILTMPQSIRAVIGVPLWGIGWVLTRLLSSLWAGLLSPALGGILPWVAAALLLMAAVVLTLKTVFPDLPLKKLLNKRNFLTVFLGMAALTVADLLLGYFIPDRDGIRVLVKLCGSLAVMAAAVIPAILAENARRRERSIPVDSEAAFREKVLALADSAKQTVQSF